MKTQLALPGETTPAIEVERMVKIREAIGPDIKLMCDINQRWRVEQAIDIGRRVEDAGVGLFWLDDAEPTNNLGQENVDVKKLASPAVFRFPLRNDAPGRRHFRLEADAYPPPVPPPCPEAPDATGRPARDPAAGIARLAAHRREAHPLPPGWSVAFSPAAEFVLAGGEQIDIVATVTVSGTVPEPRPVNVNALADGMLAGGVTLFVHS
jgi:hypothetical protein